MIITAFNPLLDELEKTYLNKAESAGTTVHQVKNASNFAISDRVLIGEMGREKSEIVTVSAVTDDTITTGATLYPHDSNEPIYKLRYDQAKFYRSTDGIDGTYSLLTTIDLDMDQEELTTLYDDVSGLSTYHYKIAYYHSVATLESSLSDAVPGTGYDRGTVGYFIDQFLIETGDTKEEYVSRSEIYGWLNDVNDDLRMGVSKPYNWLKRRVAFTRTAGEGYIDFPTDSVSGEITIPAIDRLRHNFNDGVTDKWETLTEMPIEEYEVTYDENDTDGNDTLKHYAIDEATDKIRIGPVPVTTQTAALYLYYWALLADLDSEGDRFQTPTQKPYKSYCLMKFYRKKQVKDSSFKSVADEYGREYATDKFKLKGVDRRSQGTPRSMAPPSTPHSRHKGNRSYS